MHGAARLQAQDTQGRWHELARDAQAATRQQSWLAADAPLDIKALRLTVEGDAPKSNASACSARRR